MVTILPKEEPMFGEAIGQFGKGALEGYMKRSDEGSIRTAIENLGPNPSARQILDALTKTNTYSNEAKQQLLENYLGVEKFEEIKRHAQNQEKLLQQKNQTTQEINTLKNSLKETQEKDKKQKELNDSLLLIDRSDLQDVDKENLREKVKSGEASFDAIKEVLKPNKQQIKAKEASEHKAITQRAFNDLVKLVPDVGLSGLPTSKLGGKTANAYAQFSSLTGALESQLVEQVNRGALSNTRFKYITETLLPKPSDTQAEIVGKLTGLATILDLDASVIGTGSEQQNADANGRRPLSAFEVKE